ncbi:MAG TPA: MFS transporter [Stellaceae bacterium]|nr:MFS transporter [Stellaceae bacterium]
MISRLPRAPSDAPRRNEPAGAEARRYPSAGYAWYVCAVLLLAYIFSFLDRTIVGLLVIPIEHDLGLNDTQVSLLQGFSFALFYALLGLPIARLVDARDRRAIIALGIALWSVTTAACGLAQRFWHLFLARVGVGAGEATLLPGATSLLADYFAPRRRGLALGVFAAGIYLGAGFAMIIGGLLLRLLGERVVHLPVLGALHPWQTVFIAVGAPGLLVALLMAATVREPARLGAARSQGAGLPLGEVARYFWRNAKTVLCHNLGFTLLAFASYAATAWIPTIFIRVHHWSAASIGLRLGAILLIVGPSGTVAGGWLADRFEAGGSRAGKLLVGLIASLGLVVPAVAFPLVASPELSLALLVPFIFFTSAVWGLSPAALQEIMPNEMRGQATALYTGLVNLLGLGFGPASVAILADYVFHDPQRLNLACAIVTPIAGLAAALLFALGREPYRRTRDRLEGGSGAE